MAKRTLVSRILSRSFSKGGGLFARLKLYGISNQFYKSGLVVHESVDAYFRLANGYINQGKFDKAALVYRSAISFQPTLSTVYYFGLKLAKKGNLNDQFYKSIEKVIQIPEIKSMIHLLSISPEIYQPSKLWLYFLVFNTFQIEEGGIENFKRTVNHNYFNWTADADINTQFEALKSELNWSETDIDNAKRQGILNLADKPVEFSDKKWQQYFNYLCMLWEFANKSDHLKLLEKLEEPALGNPLSIEYKNRKVTQDLCNSVIEVNTMMEVVPVNGRLRILELGAGHGRIGNVFLTAIPNVQVTIVDIPPAHYVSQWYLSNLFPNKSIFGFQEFSDYESVREKIESADIVFISPAQIDKLPSKSYDLFINICSLQEMTQMQINMWFYQINRLSKGWFYTKQYFESNNIFDEIVIKQNDYPVPSNWEPVINRTSKVFPDLFETMYKIN
jgi:putative sugar O-methyltransferase